MRVRVSRLVDDEEHGGLLVRVEHWHERQRALEERGVLVVGIRPPTVPRGTARLRITPMATHTDTDVDHLLEALAAIRSPA